MRRLILDTAKVTTGVGAFEETLKWGQPSYRTMATKSGGTIRIGHVKAVPNQIAICFHCQTDLDEIFRQLYPTDRVTVAIEAFCSMRRMRLPKRRGATAWRWRGPII